MKKTVCLLAFLVLFAESTAKDIKVFFKGVEISKEILKDFKEDEIDSTVIEELFNSAIDPVLSNLLTPVPVQKSSEAKYVVTASMNMLMGGRFNIALNAKRSDGLASFSSNASGLLKKKDDRIAFRQSVRDSTASLCKKIQEHESRNDNKLRAFVPGLAQIRKGYTKLGTSIIVAEVGTLLAGGIYVMKTKSNFDEAEKVKKRIISGVAENNAEHEAFLREYRDYNDAFKIDRAITIGLLSTAVAIYVFNVINGYVLSPSQTPQASQAFIVPTISPSGQAMASLSWTINF